MSAPALRLVCALAPFAFLFPVALQGQGDDGKVRRSALRAERLTSHPPPAR